MAESVDALVSNTSGVKSIPVRPRVWVLKAANSSMSYQPLFFYRVVKGQPTLTDAWVTSQTQGQRIFSVGNAPDYE